MKIVQTLLLLIATINISVGQKEQISLETLSGKTKEFWMNYFNNSKDIGKHEGIFAVKVVVLNLNNEKLSEYIEEAVIVELNKYHYLLLASQNHKFDGVKKSELGYLVKGKRLGDFDSFSKSDPTYYNFWGITFEILYNNIFNVTVHSTDFQIKGTNMSYSNDADANYSISTIGNIDNDQLSYSIKNKINNKYTLQRVFPETSNPVKNEYSEDWKSNGTGFLIDRFGYFATNFHVIAKAKEIEIEISSSKYPAKVIVTDKINDLAILKIDIDKNHPKDITIPFMIESDIKDVGTSVFTLGFPYALSGMGKDIKFTDGKISSKMGLDGNVAEYQVSVPIQGGNSGGPLFDIDGNIIGITSSKIISNDIENVSYAIKSSYLLNLIALLPEKIEFKGKDISNLTLTEKIKVLSPFVGIVKVK
jgi:S1-C subfamily serine protease